MQALDLIIQESQTDTTTLLPTEVANTVYRLLIKKEKQKAYDSLLTLQSEIYEMQGKCHFLTICSKSIIIIITGMHSLRHLK